MPRSEENEWWVNAVYEVIKKIPEGRVTTYKHIAKLLDTRMCLLSSILTLTMNDCKFANGIEFIETAQRARQVGTCLWNLRPIDMSSTSRQGEIEDNGVHFHNLQTVPWQRVINSKGSISHR